jgi:hypothetical protein
MAGSRRGARLTSCEDTGGDHEDALLRPAVVALVAIGLILGVLGAAAMRLLSPEGPPAVAPIELRGSSGPGSADRRLERPEPGRQGGSRERQQTGGAGG